MHRRASLWLRRRSPSLPRMAMLAAPLERPGHAQVISTTRHTCVYFPSSCFKPKRHTTHPLQKCSRSYLETATCGPRVLPRRATSQRSATLVHTIRELSQPSLARAGRGELASIFAGCHPEWQKRCSRMPRQAMRPCRHRRPSQRCAVHATAAGSARSNATATILAGLARKRRSDAPTYNHPRRRDRRGFEVLECCMHYDGSMTRPVGHRQAH